MASTTIDGDLIDLRSSYWTKRDTVSALTVYLVLLLVIPSDLVFMPLGGAGTPANMLGAVFLLVYLMGFLHPAFEIRKETFALRIAAAFFLCAMLASYCAANLHIVNASMLNGLDRGLISLSGWLGVLLLTADGVNTLARLRKLLDRVVFGATCLAVIGDIQFFTAKDLAKYISIPGLTQHQVFSDAILRGSYDRPQATAAQPLEFAFLLVVVLPIAIHLARFAPKEKRRSRWTQVAILALTVPLTVSRSGFVGLFVAAIVILPMWSRRERRMTYGLISVAFLVIEAMVPGLLHTILNLFVNILTGTAPSATSRTNAISNAAPFISQHPLFGRGFGTFDPTVYFFTDDQYVNSFIVTGIVGVTALLALFATGWVTARRARRASSDPEIRHLAQCMAASCAVILVVAGTFDLLSFAIATGMTFLLLGCTGALYRTIVSGSSVTEHMA